ncbi:peptidoglycan-binding protein [Streptomyces goshikiensis]|uniref:peptidoglycan-binding domain-containing protein n=1 Tax=Streptomyces goshikiensis TaxID=1942 RepID=UPI00378DBA40
MSAERCPNCDAVGVECGCAPQARFDPLRIRPYVSLPDPGQGDGPPPSQPVRGAVTPARPAAGTGQADTPAFGIPPVAPTHPAWPDETVPLRSVPPAPIPAPAPAPAGQSAPASRRRPLLPLLLGAAAVVVLGSGAALAMGAFGDSGGTDAALSDAKPSAPVVNAAPTAPSQASASPTRSPSASASPTRSASPSPSASASRSASPSPSPSASRSTPPSPSASASRAPSSQAPKPAPAQSLQYGDSGAEVERLQRLLASARLYRGKFNGQYDDRTENAVSEFQWRHEIFDDPWGVYGPATRKALEG